MQIAYIVLLVVFAICGVKTAMFVGPYVQKLMGLIWKDPTSRNRARVAKRVKELCADGDVPDETAVLMASQEMNLTEQHIKDALDGLTPQAIRALAKGDFLSAALKASLKVSKKIKGA